MMAANLQQTAMPDFVILPGVDGTGILVEPFMRGFPHAGKTRVMRYPDDPDQELSAIAQQVEQRIKPRQPVIFIAESFGGLVAVELLGRNLVQIAGIVFIASFAQAPRPRLLALIEQLPFQYFPWRRLPPFMLRTFALGRDASDEQIALLQRTSRSVSAQTLAHRLHLIYRYRFSHPSQTWSIPACYIQGSEDKAVPRQCADWFQQHFPQLKIHLVKGGHFLLSTRPRQCSEIVEAFYRDMLASSAERKV